MRHFTQERALLAIFSLYLAGLILLLLFLRTAANDTMAAVLKERANALLTVLVEKPPGSTSMITPQFTAKWLQPSMADGPFERAASLLMQSPNGARHDEMSASGADAGYRAAVSNGKGDVLTLRLPIDSSLAEITASFQRVYVFLAVLGLLILSGVSVVALRRRPVTAASRAPQAFASSRESNPLLTLLLVVALSAVIFVLELRLPLEAGVGVAFVAVVLVSLRFGSGRAVYLTAALCTALSVIALLLAKWDAQMWSVIANRTLRVFAIWAVALLGLWQRRSLRAQVAARAETDQIREMNQTLQDSLSRAELAEGQLRRGQRLLDAVARMARIGGWEFDVKTQTPHWSDEVYQIHEMDPAQKPDLSRSLEFYRPEVRTVVQRAMELAIRNGTPFDLTVPFVTAKGRSLWVRTIGTAQQIDGTTVRLSGAMQDLTVQHEVQLRQSRGARLTAEGLWEYDFTTKLVWCSETFQAVLGFPAQERMASLAELLKVHTEDAQNAQSAFDYHIATGAPFNLLARKATAAGKWRWFRLRGAVERDDGGAPLRFCGTLNDVHQEKLIHEELKLTRLRLNRAISGSSDGLYEIDLTENTTEWYSPRARELLGYGPDDAFPASIKTLAHAEDAAALLAGLQTSTATDARLDLICRLLTRDGTYRWIRVRGRSERDGAGVAVLFSGSLQDMTGQKEADAALEAATLAAASANRAKGDFLANMSHEIRTPMNGVLGMTELLLDTKLDASQREFADTIRTSATSLLIIINDLLDFSKIEAGKLELEHIPMDLRACVEDVALLMAVNANAKKLELVVNVQPGVPDHVIGDPHRLAQVLINLIGNAIKFTRHGEIYVEVSPVAMQSGRHLLHFEIRDTGMGMPPEVLTRLFQPFTQADVSTTRHHGGTGLGLSIVRRLIGLMGGEIAVESRVNEGSTFSFTLAFETAEEQQTQSAVAVDVVDTRNVLIVDDNETNRRVLKGQLERAGFVTHPAANAEEVDTQLRAAASCAMSFDAAIIDDRIPGSSGLEVAAKLREHSSAAGTPLIMLTSLDRNANATQLQDAGFSALLTKPIRRNELLSCLERVLSDRPDKEGRLAPAIVTRGSLAGIASRHRFAGRVLVVEDNPVNQDVARRFLERLGCEVALAGNGAEGVDAFFASDFALVLMDVQMPVMDGLEATREIRRREANGHVPIVALTASAMTDEMERCLAAGMDALLTKPIEPVKLHDILKRFGLEVASGAAAVAVPPVHEERPVDIAALLSLADGDADFVRELCKTFELSAVAISQEMTGALETDDRARIVALAHKLKGGSASIRAAQLSEACAHLEASAKSLPREALDAAVAQLSLASRAVRPFVERSLQ